METKEVLAARYRLEQRLATGGMGDVWVASDELLGRRVAVKVLHPHLATDDGFRRRFHAEAQAAARLSHPGIVAIYDYGEEGDVAFLTMELVDGEPLSAVISRRGRMTPDETMSLVAQAADALAVAHAEGLVHRDVKPANLLLRPDGRVKVTDFGIVRAAGVATLTGDGSVLGTVAYMSPEQVRGERVTAASDVYSLGVVAYECLTGSRPFDGDDSISVALAHLQSAVPQLPGDAPGGVRDLVTAMLQKDPDDRPESADAVSRSARPFAKHAVETEATARRGAEAERRASAVTGVADDAAARRTGRAARVPAGDDTARGSTAQFGPVEAAPLVGLARGQTASLPVQRAPGVVLHAPRAARQWIPVAVVAAAALVLALLLATAFGGRSASAVPSVTVPALRGMTVQAAEHRLLSLGLKDATGSSDPSPSALVVGERPSPGTRVAKGSTVELTVGSQTTPTAPPTTTAPTPPPPPGHGTGTDGNGPPGNGGGHGHGNHG